MAIRLLVVGREPILLYGLEQLFRAEPDLEVTTAAGGAAEAAAATIETSAEVLLLELPLDGKDPFAGLPAIRRLPEPPRIIILARSITTDQLVEALANGVRGVLLKELPPRLFVEAVRKVHRGERWVERRSESLALDGFVRREALLRELSSLLTAREIEVVLAIGNGLSNKEIGQSLKISHATVKAHLQNVFRKLEVDSRIALLNWVEERFS